MSMSWDEARALADLDRRRREGECSCGGTIDQMDEEQWEAGMCEECLEMERGGTPQTRHDRQE